jgi:hypothetical protein
MVKPPKSISLYLLPMMAMLLFACGVAVGQGAGRWRVAKYLVRSEATELDREFQSIQIEEMQGALNLLEELEAPNRTGIPTFSVNPKTGKIQVLLTVHENWADTAPLAEVENSLKSQAQDILDSLKFHMREISDADVDITFSKVNLRTSEIVNHFAEYKNGDLTIRH